MHTSKSYRLILFIAKFSSKLDHSVILRISQESLNYVHTASECSEMLLVLFLLLGGVNELKMYLGFYFHRRKDKKEISQNLWGLVALLFL